MPLVQYSHPQRQINISKGMPSPVKIASIVAWIKSARKVIPEIPECTAAHHPWTTGALIMTENSILLELIEKTTRERCSIVIDRKFSFIGG